MFLKSLTILKEKVPNHREYPFSLPFVKNNHVINFFANITFFVGENGSGKSTLLEAIAYQCGFNTAGGGRNNNYYTEASEAALGNYVRLSWLPKITNGFFMRSESFYQFATHVDEICAQDSYGGRSLHRQSHGESFLSLFKYRFGHRGIYLLDEPEAALSPARQLSFLSILKELSGTSQFIIATHSPILLGYPDAQILSFDHSPLSPIKYEDTDHYQITRRFLENRNKMLKELLE
ncbi:AAA family ATPase [Paenibacillus ehimensis]|uniref:AAA family ATPase n=1 Tax=Paenibacillus ehimensis TaxID=79264 RepID=UPI002DBB207B|nr:AAA family ATPase [Paenibacillus ehimensis]MEC0209162.1 AAA family ATPase [Paenibacillus ehimensis]